MAYRLRIIFDGLVAVGPAPPEKGSTLDGPLFAIMPFAPRSRSQGGEYTSVHFPVIVTKTKPDKEHSRPYDEYTETGWYVWYPMRERIEVAFEDPSGPGELTYGGEPAEECRESIEECCKEVEPEPGSPRRKVVEVNIRAVSNMREIWPRHAKVRRTMFHRKAPHEVAAQVFVPRGYVTGGTDDDSYPDGVPIAYLPKKTKKEVHKCAVPQVVVKVDVEKVKFAMYSLETGEQLDAISFVLDDHADIRIMNADPEAIRTLLDNKELTDQNRCGTDIDFEQIYKVLRWWPRKPVPVPVVRRFMLRPCYATLVGGG